MACRMRKTSSSAAARKASRSSFLAEGEDDGEVPSLHPSRPPEAGWRRAPCRDRSALRSSRGCVRRRGPLLCRLRLCQHCAAGSGHALACRGVSREQPPREYHERHRVTFDVAMRVPPYEETREARGSRSDCRSLRGVDVSHGRRLALPRSSGRVLPGAPRTPEFLAAPSPRPWGPAPGALGSTITLPRMNGCGTQK